MGKETPALRIDKWLWAARFFKTRALAHTAVSSGKVQANGCKAKPSRMVSPGDRLFIVKADLEFDITVLEISANRRSAALAAQMYEETEESRVKRSELLEMKRLQNQAEMAPPRRPDKRDRRKIRQFLRKNEE